MKDFITRNFGWVIGLIIFAFIMYSPRFQGCREGAKPVRDTLSDKTVYQQQPTVIVVPMPGNQVSSTQPIVIPPQYQPNADYAQLVKQYEELAKKYLAVNKYKDSISLKDSSGNRVGVVNLNQTVSENELKEIAPDYTLNLPVRTITLREYPPKKTEWFYGVEAMGNSKDYINGGFIGLQVKNKKDNIISAGIGVLNSNGLREQFKVGYYKKF